VGKGPGMRRLDGVLAHVPERSVDCVVALPGPADLDAVAGLFVGLRRVLVDSGVVWLNFVDDQGCGGTAWRTAFVLQREGWILRNAVIWLHTKGSGYSTLLLLVKQRSYWFDLDAIREPQRTPRLVGGRGKNPGDVWLVSADCGAGLPVEIAMRCIAAGCPPGGVVLGLSQTGAGVEVAARILGRRFVGLEPGGMRHAA
jgi:hypothetical protein